MTKQKHFKRRVRERMRKTGESYTTARLHLLETLPAAPEVAQPNRRAPGRIRFRSRRRCRRGPRLPGLRQLALAYTMVISLAIGAAGFITLAGSTAPSSSPLHVTEARP